MGRKKEDKGIYHHARFNRDYPEDADVLDIIAPLLEQRFTFKQIASDAILRAAGKTPEMYSRAPIPANFATQAIEEMLERFARELLAQLKAGGYQAGAGAGDDEDDGETTPFATQFARSFMERQSRARGGK